MILLIGSGSAIFIYRTAMNDSNNDSGYEVVGSFVYPGSAENSKKYVHDLQLYGGKAAVLADEFMRWFSGLWQGKSLAFTVACFTLCISYGVYLVAKNMPSRFQLDDTSKKTVTEQHNKLN